MENPDFGSDRSKRKAVAISCSFFFFMKGGDSMDKKRHIISFILIIAVIGYIMVATAAKHCAIDEYNLRQWRYEHAVRP